VILATQALKFGYRWVPRNGRKIHFWEDTWFSTTPLAVQFWDLFYICNEKTKTITEILVDGEVRLTFRRTFSVDMMHGGDLMVVVEQVKLNDDFDVLIWVYEKSGTYSSHSFYAIISYRGVTPMYISATWNIKVPPKIQLFLWLLFHGKLATIDNLNKGCANLSSVVSVMKSNQLIISFFIVLLLKWCGALLVNFLDGR
jgi:hypothetical protein